MTGVTGRAREVPRVSGLFQSLSGALSPSKRFEGNLTGYREGRLELHSVNSYGVNQSFRLAVALSVDGRKVEEAFRIHLVASRLLADGRTIQYDAVFQGDAERQAMRLGDLWQARQGPRSPLGQPHAGAEMRARPRLGRVFRVRSQGFQNFRATTRDVSETGICVACEGPVEPGRELDLTLDLDTVNAPSLRCRALVVWCRPEGGPRTWLVGFHFTDLSPHGLLVLRAFLEHVRALAEDPHGQGPP